MAKPRTAPVLGPVPSTTEAPGPSRSRSCPSLEIIEPWPWTGVSGRGRPWSPGQSPLGHFLGRVACHVAPQPGSQHFRQIGTDRSARIGVAVRLLACAVGRDVGGECEQLGVAAVAADQVGHAVASRASALGALDSQHIDFADQVGEDDRAVAGQRASFLSLHDLIMGRAGTRAARIAIMGDDQMPTGPIKNNITNGSKKATMRRASATRHQFPLASRTTPTSTQSRDGPNTTVEITTM
jgi:hypothetical protein